MKWLFSSGEGLRSRAVRSGVWAGMLRGADLLSNLIKLVVLARLLAPADFGTLGIALLTLGVLETFSQTGFQQALIQKSDDIKDDLNSAWTVLILRGAGLFALLYFLAPFVADFFNSPQATAVIQVMGATLLLQGITNIGVIHFQKDLEFNRQFLFRFSGTVVDVIVSITLVLLFRNVWALVFGLVARDATRFIVSYIIHPYRPGLSFDVRRAGSLFRFGKWILGSSILLFLLTQGDDILVGKLLGVAALGFYQLAYRISNSPATEITHVVSLVAFPLYSKLQSDAARLRGAYLKVLKLISFLAFPVSGLILVLAPDFTGVFLGAKWMPMVPALQLLCIFGATRMLNATTGPVFQGIGRPGVSTIGSVFQLIIFASIIYPLTLKWGLIGASLAVIMPNLFFMAYIAYQMTAKVGFRFAELAGALAPSFIASAAAFGLIHYLKANFWGAMAVQGFAVYSVLGLVSYAVFSLALDRIFPNGTRDILLGLFRGGAL